MNSVFLQARRQTVKQAAIETGVGERAMWPWLSKPFWDQPFWLDWVHSPAILEPGDWDVHWGYGILTHGHVAGSLGTLSGWFVGVRRGKSAFLGGTSRLTSLNMFRGAHVKLFAFLKQKRQLFADKVRSADQGPSLPVTGSSRDRCAIYQCCWDSGKRRSCLVLFPFQREEYTS